MRLALQPEDMRTAGRDRGRETPLPGPHDHRPRDFDESQDLSAGSRHHRLADSTVSKRIAGTISSKNSNRRSIAPTRARHPSSFAFSPMTSVSALLPARSMSVVRRPPGQAITTIWWRYAARLAFTTMPPTFIPWAEVRSRHCPVSPTESCVVLCAQGEGNGVGPRDRVRCGSRLNASRPIQRS